MKILRICSFALALVLAIVLLSSSITVAQDSDPEAVYRTVQELLNQGDLDGAMALHAEDAVNIAFPPPPGADIATVGKEAIRQLIGGLVDQGGIVELRDFQVNGDMATYTAFMTIDDFLAEYDVYPLEFYGFVVVRGGLVQSTMWHMTQASRIKLDKAMTAIELDMNKVLAHRYLEEMWDEGDMDVADEIIADDFVDYNPMFGNTPDKAGLMAQAANFHEGGLKNRIDDLVVSADSIVLRVTVMQPDEDNELVERLQGVILLGVADGQIIDRRIALFGFGPPWEN